MASGASASFPVAKDNVWHWLAPLCSVPASCSRLAALIDEAVAVQGNHDVGVYVVGEGTRVELDGQPVHISRHKAVALLAYLVMTKQSHRRESLAVLLWPEYDDSRARADLRRTLSVLNRTLGSGWLCVDRETAALDADADLWLDTAEFQAIGPVLGTAHPTGYPTYTLLAWLASVALPSRFGAITAARTATSAMTTISSIRVKPDGRIGVDI